MLKSLAPAGEEKAEGGQAGLGEEKQPLLLSTIVLFTVRTKSPASSLNNSPQLLIHDSSRARLLHHHPFPGGRKYLCITHIFDC